MASFNDVYPLQRSEKVDKAATQIKIFDLHDYSGATTEGVTYADVIARVFTIYDSAGDLLLTVDATIVYNQDYTITVSFDKDMYFKSKLTIVTSSNDTYVNETEFGLTGQALYKIDKLIDRNRANCDRSKINKIISSATDIVKSAERGLKYDARYLFDERMDDANKLLDNLSYC